MQFLHSKTVTCLFIERTASFTKKTPAKDLTFQKQPFTNVYKIGLLKTPVAESLFCEVACWRDHGTNNFGEFLRTPFL